MRSNKLIYERKSAERRPSALPQDSNRTRIEISSLENETQMFDSCRVEIGNAAPPQKGWAHLFPAHPASTLDQQNCISCEGGVKTSHNDSTKEMNPLLETLCSKVVAAPARTPANPPQRILVVEDDVAVRQLNALVLVRSGYQVEAAEDGAAGWEALHANHFDLLITDHDMPKLTGLELVKKARGARMSLPVILASGSLHTEEVERHPWLQLAATLLKPFSPHQLLETVKEVLRAAARANTGTTMSDRSPIR